MELSGEFLVSPVSSLSKLGCCFLSPQQRHPGPTWEKGTKFCVANLVEILSLGRSYSEADLHLHYHLKHQETNKHKTLGWRRLGGTLAPVDTALSLPEPTPPVTPKQGGVLLLGRLQGVILEYSQLSPSCQFSKF